MSFTSGVIWVCASIVCASSTGGFVLAGRFNCIPRSSTNKTIAVHLSSFRKSYPSFKKICGTISLSRVFVYLVLRVLLQFHLVDCYIAQSKPLQNR